MHEIDRAFIVQGQTRCEAGTQCFRTDRIGIMRVERSVSGAAVKRRKLRALFPLLPHRRKRHVCHPVLQAARARARIDVSLAVGPRRRHHDARATGDRFAGSAGVKRNRHRCGTGNDPFPHPDQRHLCVCARHQRTRRHDRGDGYRHRPQPYRIHRRQTVARP